VHLVPRCAEIEYRHESAERNQSLALGIGQWPVVTTKAGMYGQSSRQPIVISRSPPSRLRRVHRAACMGSSRKSVSSARGSKRQFSISCIRLTRHPPAKILGLERVLESTLYRPFPQGKMTPTRLELGETPCLLVFQNAQPSALAAQPEQRRRPPIILPYDGHGPRLIRASLGRVHTHRFMRNNESASHLERFRHSVRFDSKLRRLCALLQYPFRPIRDGRR
jgi:hypothetical protein